jgi:hypothetical protein
MIAAVATRYNIQSVTLSVTGPIVVIWQKRISRPMLLSASMTGQYLRAPTAQWHAKLPLLHLGKNIGEIDYFN